MAKKTFVSGKTINDLLNLDIETFNKLGASDMRKVVSRLASAGNKRLRSFERRKETTPATRYIHKSGGYFSTKGKNLNQLRAEYMRAKSFFGAKTSTAKGWMDVKQRTIQTLKDSGIDITDEQFSTFWKAYEELKELNPGISAKRLKYAILHEVRDTMIESDLDPEEIAAKLQNQISRIYEESMAQNNDVGGVSEFFEL